MKFNKNILLNVVLFGAIWGILEASFGYALHFLPSLLAGCIMFPIGATLMFWAYRNTNSRGSMIAVAFLAAAIKAINLFMPGKPAIYTYNPMISMILQSLLVTAAVAFFEKKHWAVQVGAIAASSFLWRALFIANVAINYSITGFFSTQLTSVSTILSFIFVNALLEIVFLSGLFLAYRFASKKVHWTFKPHWAISFSTLAAAIAFMVLPIVF